MILLNLCLFEWVSSNFSVTYFKLISPSTFVGLDIPNTTGARRGPLAVMSKLFSVRWNWNFVPAEIVVQWEEIVELSKIVSPVLLSLRNNETFLPDFSSISMFLTPLGRTKNLVKSLPTLFVTFLVCTLHLDPSPAHIPHWSSFSGELRILSQPTLTHWPCTQILLGWS